MECTIENHHQHPCQLDLIEIPSRITNTLPLKFHRGLRISIIGISSRVMNRFNGNISFSYYVIGIFLRNTSRFNGIVLRLMNTFN